jgi:hypothetical protein
VKSLAAIEGMRKAETRGDFDQNRAEKGSLNKWQRKISCHSFRKAMRGGM